MSEKKMLIQKLTEVMDEVQYIQKTGTNRKQGYRYAEESAVVEKCRAELAKRKVFLKQDVKSAEFNRSVKTKGGGEMAVATLTIEFTFIDGETGERESFTGIGEGMDSGDKAVYKAMTGALKYALMKTFMIPTGDDPERDNEPPRETPNKTHRQPKQSKTDDTPMTDEDAMKITSLVLDITGDDNSKKNRLETWLRNKIPGFKSLDDDMTKKIATMVIGYLQGYKSKKQEAAGQ